MFWVLLVFVFTAPDGYVAEMASRQLLAPKFEPTEAACRKDALAALSFQTPDGVIVGVKCDGPFMDPTVPTLRN